MTCGDPAANLPTSRSISIQVSLPVLGVLQAMMEDDRDAVSGPKRRHQVAPAQPARVRYAERTALLERAAAAASTVVASRGCPIHGDRS